MMNKKYYVTGAAGFLGGTVVRQLTAQGEAVRCFVLPGDPARQFIPQEAEIVEGDLLDEEAIERFLSGPEDEEKIVLHIASIVAMDEAYSEKVMKVNVDGTKLLLESAIRNHVAKFVYCSSTGAIPELPRGMKIHEVDRFTDLSVRGCYSQSKALATQAVLDAAHYRGLDACVVHPSGIMGPGDYAMNGITQSLLGIIHGEMPAGIEGSFNLCDVRDLAAGLISASEHGRSGECYILGNEEVTFRAFADMVCEESGGKKVAFFLPAFAARWVASLSEMQARGKKKKPILSSFAVYNLLRNNDFDSTKARTELGYTTRSYQETIHDQVEWLRENGMLEPAGKKAA